MIILFGFAAFISTLAGGLFALKFKDKLHLILGFSAGAVIGVGFFDLLPESINLGQGRFGISFMTSLIAAGFLLYMLLDRAFAFHCHGEDCKNPNHKIRLGALSLSLHSFIDGIAIGLAFQVSAAIGFIVAIAVLSHDFSDGLNTVNLVIKDGGTKMDSYRWLIIDAFAPTLGVFSTLFFTLPQDILGILLAVFCGFFLYIGASDLLPESHHAHPTKLTTFLTALGILFIYFMVKLAET